MFNRNVREPYIVAVLTSSPLKSTVLNRILSIGSGIANIWIARNKVGLAYMSLSSFKQRKVRKITPQSVQEIFEGSKIIAVKRLKNTTLVTYSIDFTECEDTPNPDNATRILHYSTVKTLLNVPKKILKFEIQPSRLLVWYHNTKEMNQALESLDQFSPATSKRRSTVFLSSLY